MIGIALKYPIKVSEQIKYYEWIFVDINGYGPCLNSRPIDLL